MPMSNADADRLRSSLSLTAQSANELQAVLPKPGLPMEPGLPDLPTNASISDKFFHRQGLPRRTSATWPAQQDASIDPTFFETPEEQAALLEATTVRAATFPRPIAMKSNAPQQDFTSEFGSSSRHSRPKVRGRFSASRRKEVQEVRKRGACIRCRMLKKPVRLSATFKSMTDSSSALVRAPVVLAEMSRVQDYGSSLVFEHESLMSFKCILLVSKR
jgi:hypothetical protein